MKMCVLGLITGLLMMSNAGAFVANGTKWENITATFKVNIPGESPSGITWNDAIIEAMARWEAVTVFEFEVDNVYVDPCTGYFGNNMPDEFPGGEGDDINAVDFKDSICGNDWGAATLAVTLSIAEDGMLPPLKQADVLFNSNLSWDVYDGNLQGSNEFRRVAVHELGHAIGLNHEFYNTAIMQPTQGSLYIPQQDDMDGIVEIYQAGTCTTDVITVNLNQAVTGFLDGSDCRMSQIAGGRIGDPTLVDEYVLDVDAPVTIAMRMESAAVDPWLYLLDENRTTILDNSDDDGGQLNSQIVTLSTPGRYILQANTALTTAEVGEYSITIVSPDTLPPVGTIASLRGTKNNSVVYAGATSDNGVSFTSQFSGSDSIDVLGAMRIDSNHVYDDRLNPSVTGELFVIINIPGYGYYQRNYSNQYVSWNGDLRSLNSYISYKQLFSTEVFPIAIDLMGDQSGLSGMSFQVFLGYTPSTDSNEIFFNGTPLEFAISSGQSQSLSRVTTRPPLNCYDQLREKFNNQAYITVSSEKNSDLTLRNLEDRCKLDNK